MLEATAAGSLVGSEVSAGIGILVGSSGVAACEENASFIKFPGSSLTYQQMVQVNLFSALKTSRQWGVFLRKPSFIQELFFNFYCLFRAIIFYKLSSNERCYDSPETQLHNGSKQIPLPDQRNLGDIKSLNILAHPNLPKHQ